MSLKFLSLVVLSVMALPLSVHAANSNTQTEQTRTEKCQMLKNGKVVETIDCAFGSSTTTTPIPKSKFKKICGKDTDTANYYTEKNIVTFGRYGQVIAVENGISCSGGGDSWLLNQKNTQTFKGNMKYDNYYRDLTSGKKVNQRQMDDAWQAFLDKKTKVEPNYIDCVAEKGSNIEFCSSKLDSPFSRF